MRYSVTYPNTFNANALFAHQSPVPSQACDPANLPFSPDQPWGISQGGSDAPLPAQSDYVLYTYDSRPGQGYDFVTDLTTIVIPDIPPTFMNPYVVPAGYVAIVRKIELEYYVTNGAGGPWLNTNGSSGFDMFASITINQIPVPGYSHVNVSEAVYSCVELECFIVAASGDGIAVLNDAIVVANTANIRCRLYGNLLLATGRNLPLEYTTPEPIPVEISGPSTVTAGTP